MSEEENFLTRWSRRKRAAADQDAELSAAREPEPEATEPGPESTKDGAKAGAPKQDVAAEPAAELEFDLTSLPPIESIVAETDIRPFLRPGVPADLTRAALRRAWSVDPAIRDYIGPSENSWDFTAAGPNGVPGFDFGDPGVDVRALAEQLFGRVDEATEQSSAPPAPDAPTGDEAPQAPSIAAAPATPKDHDLLKAEPNRNAVQSADVADQDLTASQQQPDEAAADVEPVRRRHGSALPS